MYDLQNAAASGTSPAREIVPDMMRLECRAQRTQGASLALSLYLTRQPLPAYGQDTPGCGPCRSFFSPPVNGSLHVAPEET